MQHFGQTASKHMTFAVDMLLDREVENDRGQRVTLTYTRLRYELDIVSETNPEGLDQLLINHEALKVIPAEQDRWLVKHSALPAWGTAVPAENSPPFQPSPDLLASERLISSCTEHGGEKILRVTGLSAPETRHSVLSYHAKSLARTLLNQMKGAEYVHISAVRAEMASWRCLHLDPEALRQPNTTRSPRMLSARGNHLASTLARLQTEDASALNNISRDMAHFVPGMQKIRVDRESASKQYSIKAIMCDQQVFRSQVLSDGTLRLLALSTLKNDPEVHGVLCLEEPENGVSPAHVERMIRLLRQMATDVYDPSQINTPLCQVLVTTHSPLVISQPDALNALLLAIVSTRLDGASGQHIQATILFPAMTSEVLSHLDTISREEKALGAYTANMINAYLDSQLLEEAREEVEKGHRQLNQR